jgi:hypothetical protein
MILKIGTVTHRTEFFFGGLRIAEVVKYTSHSVSYERNLPKQNVSVSVYLRLPFVSIYEPNTFESEQAAIESLRKIVGGELMMNSLRTEVSEQSSVKEHKI